MSYLISTHSTATYERTYHSCTRDLLALTNIIGLKVKPESYTELNFLYTTESKSKTILADYKETKKSISYLLFV